MIPQRDILKAAVIEAPDYYSRLVCPWRNTVPEVDLSAALLPVLNQFYSSVFKHDQLVTEPQSWAVLDYTVGAPVRASVELHFRASRDATAHGLLVWFETILFEEIGYSSAPASATSVHGQLFFPWLDAVPLKQGQAIQIALHADPVGRNYTWRWETKIPPTTSSPEINFQQSTFQGEHFSSQLLRRAAVDYVPQLSDEGQADLWMLERMGGSASLQQIAQAASEQFPRLFPSWHEAFLRAAELSKDFSH